MSRVSYDLSDFDNESKKMLKVFQSLPICCLLEQGGFNREPETR